MTTALAILIGLAAAPSWASEQFYKWVDPQGVTHYSADPPPKSATSTSEVKVSTRLPDDEGSPPDARKPAADAAKTPTTTDGGKKADSGETSDTGKTPPPQYAERCKTLQSNLQIMQEHAKVRVVDEKGQASVMSGEDKQKQMDDTQRQIKAFCQ